MFMGFMDTEQANQVICRGLIIEGKKVNFRRHRIDLQRCLKCQTIGAQHQAAECKMKQDICGHCAELH